MRLESITIEGFRSLEKVTLENLGQVNVLVGRNNSGKSSVFNLLKTIQDALNQRGVDFEKINTGRKSDIKQIEISIEFSLERKIIKELASSYISGLHLENFLKSELLSRLKLIGCLQVDGLFFTDFLTYNYLDTQIEIFYIKNNSITVFDFSRVELINHYLEKDSGLNFLKIHNLYMNYSGVNGPQHSVSGFIYGTILDLMRKKLTQYSYSIRIGMVNLHNR